MALANHFNTRKSQLVEIPQLLFHYNTFPTHSGRYLVVKRSHPTFTFSSDIFGVSKHATKTATTRTSMYLPIWVLIIASASFPGKPFHISRKHGKCDWSLVVHQSQQKPLITLIRDMPQQEPVLAISPLEAIYPSWSWCHHVPPMRPCARLTPRLPKVSRSTSSVTWGPQQCQLRATIQPHVTCLQVDPFWDTRLRFRMYTVFRASVWRFTKVHQTSAFDLQKTSMSDNSNLSYVSKRCWTTCFKQDFSCVLWVPNSERHCDSLFTEVGSLFKTRTDEKVWQHFLQRQKNLSNKRNIQ